MREALYKTKTIIKKIIMSKEKDSKRQNVKKAPLKNLKEKRAAKAAKKADKNKGSSEY